MLFTMNLTYRVDERDEQFVTKKLQTYSHGYVAPFIAGLLTDMSITERKIEFEFGKQELVLHVDTFGVELEPEEQEQVEMTMRDAYIQFVDTPIVNDNREIHLEEVDDPKISIMESQTED